MITNRDIGFVHDGQEVAIKVDTFDCRDLWSVAWSGGEIGIASAIVRNKPADISNDNRKRGAENDSSEPNGQEYVYAARIALNQTQMQIDERLVTLSPGMAVTVEIKTGTRRVIEYLLSPLAKHQHKSLRER